ncbi:methyl-accepting chemotaxis protein [Pleurocapsa sp. PCC 7319]|uniref:methyl-accepting chemotaxis protein n=1 Tax=Pleurocapsa sp. PCC 7319 TaxID=118161 RepID=UPI00034AA3DA|nr:methyl-accepting chemotaxis protein [Pleurocapsa sp. PCC 7319]
MKVAFFRSLRVQIPLLILIGMIPSILVSLSLASFNATKIIREDAQEKLALETQGLEHSLSKWNEMNVRALKNLSKQPAIVSMEVEKQKPVLMKMLETYEYLYTASTTGLDGINVTRSDNQAPKKYADRPWFLGAKAGNDITYQTLIGRTSNKPSLCLSVPIRQQKVIKGVNYICATLDIVSEQIKAVKFGTTGYALLVNENGQVLAHPDSTFTSGDTLTDLSKYPPVNNLLSGNEGEFVFSDDTNTEWMTHGTLLNNGWGVLVLQEKAEVFASVKQFKQTAILIALASVALVSIIAWFVAESLVKPVISLTNVSTSLAAGNLDQTVNIERQDELGLLGIAFNKMARQLQESFATLGDRTQELDRALTAQKQSEQAQKTAKEKLQQQVRELQRQLKLANNGDLTVRAQISEGEIGQVASSYNSTLESLRQIVAQVQLASQTVAKTTNLNELAISELSAGAMLQTDEITNILNQMQTMSVAIQAIADNADRAEKIIEQTTDKASAGDIAIEQTVQRISTLGQTASETTEQAKNLAKASRKIAKTIGLIRKIALQTNVLAVNASIEAARAGEEGIGFTVVADEVQVLATQSAQAATEIEQLVGEIQFETSKVVKAMETSTIEVTEGSRNLVAVRTALQQVKGAREEVDRLIKTVTTVVTEQSLTSRNLTATMEDVSAIAHKTSTSATKVSSSFQDLLTVAQQLEASVGQFKVN